MHELLYSQPCLLFILPRGVLRPIALDAKEKEDDVQVPSSFLFSLTLLLFILGEDVWVLQNFKALAVELLQRVIKEEMHTTKHLMISGVCLSLLYAARSQNGSAKDQLGQQHSVT